MVFIRLKKRAKKSGEVYYYAYLVNNKWVNLSPKQEIKLYLGRYHKIDSKTTENIILPKNIKKNQIFAFLLKKVLLVHGFKPKDKFLFHHPNGFLVNLKANKVVDKKTQKQVCLGLNQGYLCDCTLKKLFDFSINPKNKKEKGPKLIKVLLDVGINLHKDLFMEIFNILTKK
ncbi:hypothetical protein HYX16_05440 [Candidatus Woesearchaeota archaeon]|nr:hypothetical protein [Candidatus Woesearchaeota archaeon]